MTRLAPDERAVRAATRRTHLVRSDLSGLVVGVDALQVAAIEDESAPADAEVQTVDLAAFFGLGAPQPRPEGGSPRRALVVAAGGRRLRLVIGEVVRVEALAPDAIRPVPAFAAEFAARAGIASIFLSGGESLGYVLDVERLGTALVAEEVSR